MIIQFKYSLFLVSGYLNNKLRLQTISIGCNERVENFLQLESAHTDGIANLGMAKVCETMTHVSLDCCEVSKTP